jgi:TolB-like protein
MLTSRNKRGTTPPHPPREGRPWNIGSGRARFRPTSACKASVPRMLRRGAGLCVACLLLIVPASRAQEATLEQAITAYNSADYDRAVDLLSVVAKDTTLDKAARREALQYLGRSYIAKRMTDDARETITELVELEPPIVELNPDVEPPPLVKLYYEVRKDLSGDYVVERPDPGLKTLAIVGFSNNALDDRERFDPLEWGMASILINYLNGATDLKVIERERLQWLLDELDLNQDGGRVDQSTAVRMGKLLGATTMLLGGFTVLGKQMQINARLVKVETGEILMTEQVTGKTDKLFELAEELSLKVAKGINVTLTETQVGARTETKSLDAMLSYSEGLSLLEKDEYRAAYEKFLEALEFDPKYTQAQLKAESIKPMLASG